MKDMVRGKAPGKACYTGTLLNGPTSESGKMGKGAFLSLFVLFPEIKYK